MRCCTTCRRVAARLLARDTAVPLLPRRCAAHARAWLTGCSCCSLFRAQGTLVPRLAAQMQRDARRRAASATPAARRVEFGAYEGAPTPPPRGAALSQRDAACPDARPRSCHSPPRSADPGGGAARVPVRHDVPRQGERAMTCSAARLLHSAAALTPRCAARRRCGARATSCLRRTRTPSATHTSGAFVCRGVVVWLLTQSPDCASRPPALRSWVQAGGESAAAWSWNAEVRRGG